MKKIKTALISVSDKKNLKPLLNSLKQNNIKIISSGGTYKEIKKLKFNCIEVSEFTSSPESLEGRVKTLHPKIHAGILARRDSDMDILKERGYETIDLVIVNLYVPPVDSILTSFLIKKSTISFKLVLSERLISAVFGRMKLIE
jgi:phosphoribosylaminoimidazolecarboxamide formyltransferase/IMP cyclohydrolase